VTAPLAAWRRHGADGDPQQLRAALAAGTLSEAFAATAARVPERPALTVDDRTTTHGELDAAAARVAGWLVERGLQAGERILVAGPSSLELIHAYLGALRAGAIVVLADPRATAPELAHLIADAQPRLAFACGEQLEALRGDAIAGAPLALGAIALERGGAEPALTQALEGAPTAPVAPVAALLAYTSGTTGEPKGALLSHGNVLASIRGALTAWRWSEDDVLVHALPLSHQHGLSGVHAALLTGSHTVVLSQFDPQGLDSAAERHGATVLFAVPSIYERLVAHGPLPALRGLRLATCGSAPLTVELGERVGELLGQLPLERYGSTEAGLDVSNPYDGPRVLGGVGLPLPGVEVDLDGAGEDGVGELLVRGPQVFDGYWRREQATVEAFADGWFRTGDLARIDSETGYVAIVGRSKEMIISGGLNVYPAEVERVIVEHPSVVAVAVAGVPSQAWGEEVVAFVVPAAGAVAQDELVAFCRERMSAYKCPKRVVTVAELPRNRMGKVRRDVLVADVESAPGAAG